MKNKLICLLLAIFLLLSANAVVVNRPDDFLSNPVGGNEWYALDALRFGEDVSEYRAALEQYVTENEIKDLTSRILAAYTLHCAGSEIQFIYDTADAVGEGNIMSLIYGIHLLRGLKDTRLTAMENKLIGLVHQDGGYSVMGNYGDVDVTAMALQALAPDAELYSVQIEAALDFLSLKQLEDGGYASMGNENPESAAQVAIALYALGIDAEKDERFLKNGLNVFDAMSLFYVGDEVSHTIGDTANKTATMQVFMAYSAKLLYKTGKGGFYDFDKGAPFSLSPKLAASAATATVCVLVCVILFVRKKRSIKTYASVVIAAALVIIGVNTISIQSTEAYYTEQQTISGNTITTSVSINADKAGKGIILSDISIEIPAGASAFDQLIAAAKANSILVVHSGGYIQGINGIFEKDFGDLSGWMFRVNGEFASCGSGDYILNPGDKVEWIYSLEMGKDVP